MTQVKPIPDGMHTITPHLVCAGDIYHLNVTCF